MPNMTISIPLETMKKMKQRTDVSWSNAFRVMVERKLREFDEADRIAKKGGLKLADFREISEKISEASRKQGEALLHESHRRR